MFSGCGRPRGRLPGTRPKGPLRLASPSHLGKAGDNLVRQVALQQDFCHSFIFILFSPIRGTLCPELWEPLLTHPCSLWKGGPYPCSSTRLTCPGVHTWALSGTAPGIMTEHSGHPCPSVQQRPEVSPLSLRPPPAAQSRAPCCHLWVQARDSAGHPPPWPLHPALHPAQ